MKSSNEAIEVLELSGLRAQMQRGVRGGPVRLLGRDPQSVEEGEAQVRVVKALDTAAALDELQAWLERNITGRSVWVIDKIKGKWRVGLQCDAERMSASQDAELRGAIRNAIMIAGYAGFE